MKKECLGQLVHIQSKMENAIFKSKTIYNQYEDNYKGEEAYGDSSESEIEVGSKPVFITQDHGQGTRKSV
jgi:hypothetical protein